MGNTATFINSLTTLQAAGPTIDMLEGFKDAVWEETAILKAVNKEKRVCGTDNCGWTLATTTQRGQQFKGGTPISQTHPEWTKSLILEWCNLTFDISYYLTDFWANRGNKGLMEKYVAKRIEKARKDAARHLTLDLLGNGITSADGTDISTAGLPAITGLQAIAPTETTIAAGTFAYGGVTRTSTTTYLNAQTISIASLATSLDTSILFDMYQRTNHTNGPCDLIVTNDTAFKAIWNKAKAEKWPTFTREKNYDLAFPGKGIIFNDAVIVSDKHMTDDARGGVLTSDLMRIYFINSKALTLRVDSDADFALAPLIQLEGQHAAVQHLLWRGQLICEDPRSIGVITYTS